MKTNSITSTNFQAKLKINCPKDLITSSQIEALTKQAEGIGKKTDRVTVYITKEDHDANGKFFDAVNIFELAKEKFKTTSRVFYEQAGCHYKSQYPYYYVERQLSKLSEVI